MLSFSASIKFSQELCAKLWMNVENNRIEKCAWLSVRRSNRNQVSLCDQAVFILLSCSGVYTTAD